MASCKDCIHFDVCDAIKDQLDMIPPSLCGCFKYKSRFIELPCKVGDKVYVKMVSGILAEADVRDYTHFLSCGFCVVLTSTSFNKLNIPFSEFGKTVFLSKAEAEQKLKELKNGK